jgi:1-acyl-sn-glycerol-3-phosphate acyltransferase
MRMFLRQLLTFPAFFLLGTSLVVLLALSAALRGHRVRRCVKLFFFHATTRLLRMHIRVEGTLAPAPALTIANHCSYVDVMLLGTLGDVRFTPKDDVRRWPLLGTMVQAFDVIFVSRSRTDSKTMHTTFHTALQGGSRLCVFAEGTTSNGRTLKPFKASLFHLAEQWQGETPLAVQPLVVRYESVDGLPMGDAQWDTIAWYGDDTLIAHLWRLCGVRDVRATILCLPPLYLHAGENRKQLSERTRTAILKHLPHMV